VVSSYTLSGPHGVSVEAFGPVVALELHVEHWCSLDWPDAPDVVMAGVRWHGPGVVYGYGCNLEPGATVMACCEGVSLVIRRTLAP